jgi:hypothetical protein
MPEMFVLPFRPAYDSNGRTVPGAQAWFTLTGTNTETPVYSDSALTVEHANPLVADGLGRFPRAYLDPAITYRCRVYEQFAEVGVDSPIPDHDYDPYTGAEQGSQGPEGDPGDDGVNATVISPTVNTTTLAAGASATASAAHLGGGIYELSLGIPQGAAGLSGALSDGDYGDIVVSGTGTVLTVDAAAISLAKMASLTANSLIGNTTGGSATPAAVAIGAGAATSILDRAAGDGRYIQQTANRVVSLFIPAGAMRSRTTSGPAAGSAETTTNKINYVTYDFDTSATEYVQFFNAMPKSWNEGTITAQFIWAHASGSGTVTWGIQGVSLSDGDVLDTAFGTAQTVTDTSTGAGDIMVSAATGAVTLAGSPAAEDVVVFQIYRNGGSLAVDAKLIGIRLNFTVNAQDDS